MGRVLLGLWVPTLFGNKCLQVNWVHLHKQGRTTGLVRVSFVTRQGVSVTMTGRDFVGQLGRPQHAYVPVSRQVEVTNFNCGNLVTIHVGKHLGHVHGTINYVNVFLPVKRLTRGRVDMTCQHALGVTHIWEENLRVRVNVRYMFATPTHIPFTHPRSVGTTY